jgi:hypothetical protein
MNGDFFQYNADWLLGNLDSYARYRGGVKKYSG